VQKVASVGAREKQQSHESARDTENRKAELAHHFVRGVMRTDLWRKQAFGGEVKHHCFEVQPVCWRQNLVR